MQDLNSLLQIAQAKLKISRELRHKQELEALLLPPKPTIKNPYGKWCNGGNVLPHRNFREYPAATVEHLPWLEKALMEHILIMDNTVAQIYLNQGILALKYGVCTRTISRALQNLADWGFIDKLRRVEKCSFYKVSRWFHEWGNRFKLAKIWNCLYAIPKVMAFAAALLASQKNVLKPNVLRNKDDISKSINSPNTSKKGSSDPVTHQRNITPKTKYEENIPKSEIHQRKTPTQDQESTGKGLSTEEKTIANESHKKHAPETQTAAAANWLKFWGIKNPFV